MATVLRILPSSRIPYHVVQRLPGRCLRYQTTEIPKSPPPIPQPPVETFSSTSRPRPYQAKHPQTRELPLIKKKWPILLTAVLVGVAGWGAFMAYVTNKEKISSSVVRQIMRSVRDDEQLKEALGEVIRPQPEWWLNGDPMIYGRISQLQGNVDVSFRIRGTKGAGTLYFTSIRKDKGLPFTILRFKIICDTGRIIFVDAAPA
ncbi:cytochrome oxidase complex assembly protein 1-domain-containing protein [Collybia nuda]|uniref:Cytochrome oxidase complex assembly protein 1-domain-containing protein n=1 Tax=Collybia nuda TaxID=64659 RepID=A0A9P5Y3Y3_9AGAR|nr:cytochrome oxidase complex assembly protein 1-domain-containing protein [Collybia nuda]